VVVTADPIVIVDLGRQLIDFFFRARLADGVDPQDAHAGSSEIEEVAWVPRDEARLRLRGPSRFNEKFALFDDHPDHGGVVVLDRNRQRR
jgi:hypothetical protein